jgi:hypothetical protein
MSTITVSVTILCAAALYTFRVAMITLGSILYIYLLPGVLASYRGYSKASTIYWICALCGWMLLPWLGCLIFSICLKKHTGIEAVLGIADNPTPG